MIDEKSRKVESPKQPDASTRFFEEAAQHDGWSAIVKRPSKSELEQKRSESDERVA